MVAELTRKQRGRVFSYARYAEVLNEGMADLSKSIGLHASRRLLFQGPERRALDDWMRIYNFRSSAQLKS